MRVFLSWSGEPSRLVAEALRGWLPNVIQVLEPWMSSKDIDKGARWSTDIALELEQAHAGLLCLTPDNLEAPWLLFEAGALSKKLGSSLVCPYLVGVQPTDLTGPLVQFQGARANEIDTLMLLKTINRALGAKSLPENNLERVFKKWWPDLRDELSKINTMKSASTPKRTEREILEETLSLVRQIAKSQSQINLEMPLSNESDVRLIDWIRKYIISNTSTLPDTLLLPLEQQQLLEGAREYILKSQSSEERERIIKAVAKAIIARSKEHEKIKGEPTGDLKL